MYEDPIDILTPLAASVLFGRTGEAVRTAARKGHVVSPFALAFTAKMIRLLDLESAREYWAESAAENLEGQLSDMRRIGMTIEVSAQKYRILHPHRLIVRPP